MSYRNLVQFPYTKQMKRSESDKNEASPLGQNLEWQSCSRSDAGTRDSMEYNQKQKTTGREKYSAKKITQTFYDMHFGLGKIDSF